MGEDKVIPKMSDKLAAQSDVAALQFSTSFDKENYDGSDICEAHEAGQGWMYRKMQEEIDQLKTLIHGQNVVNASLIDNVSAITRQRDEYRKALELLNLKIDDLWNSGQSDKIPEWHIKQINNAQSECYSILTKYKSHE